MAGDRHGTWARAGAGTLDLIGENFTVEEHRNPDNVIDFRKSIPLAGPFSFSIDEHPGQTLGDVNGFGLKGERADVGAFSWERFNVTSPTEAVKLQEDGRITISIEQGSRGWEIARTEFETDVSLRVTRFDGDPCKEPSTRIVIRKGSWIAWPEA